MSERKVTFPVVGTEHGETIRRNAETGVEIRSSKLYRGGMEHSVYVPDAEHGYRLADYFGELTSAREEAADRAQDVREQISLSFDEAAAENAERDYQNTDMTEVEAHKAEVVAEFTEHARKQFPTVVAMVEGAAPADPDPAYVERLGFRVRPNGIGTLWTHTLTGVMIGKFPDEAYSVTVPVMGAHVEVVAGFEDFGTFAEALDHAMTLVVRWTRRIQADAEAAREEHFHRFPMIADKSSVYYAGAVRKVWRVSHVLWLQADPGDDDAMITCGYDAAWPVSRTGPKRELPTSIIGHRDVVTFAPDATVVPEAIEGATDVSPWTLDASDEVMRAPGGRVYVYVWQSFVHPEKGRAGRLAAAWLDELRTEGGAARVTLAGL